MMRYYTKNYYKYIQILYINKKNKVKNMIKEQNKPKLGKD